MQTYQGVRYESRYDIDEEEEEMRHFIQLLSSDGVLGAVKGLFYDSKANLCCIELAPSLVQGSEDAYRVHRAASRSISQFELFGIVGHKTQ